MKIQIIFVFLYLEPLNEGKSSAPKMKVGGSVRLHVTSFSLLMPITADLSVYLIILCMYT